MLLFSRMFAAGEEPGGGGITILGVDSRSHTSRIWNPTFPIPSHSSGDLLLVLTHTDQTTAMTGQGGFNQDFSKNDASGDTIFCHSKISDGTEGSEGVLNGSRFDRCSLICYVISGASGNVEGAGVTGEGADPDPPNMTPSWGAKENLWLAVSAWDWGSRRCDSIPANYADLVWQGAAWGGTTGQSDIATCWRLLNAASENPGIMVNPNDNASWPRWIAATIAIEPEA